MDQEITILVVLEGKDQTNNSKRTIMKHVRKYVVGAAVISAFAFEAISYIPGTHMTSVPSIYF